jgi:peptidylprolyl isomerase
LGVADRRDYYAILQVSRTASQEAIEKSHARLSKIYNPKSSRKLRAAARYKEISEAYSVLSDRKARADYDRAHLRRSAPGDSAVGGFISRNYIWIAAVGVIGSIALALVLIIVLGGGGSTNAVTQPTVSATVASGTPPPTPVGQTPGPTGPPSLPAVSGQEQTTSTGLKYIDIREGTGATPQLGDDLTVNYTGWTLADGKKFDSSIDRGQPFSFAFGYCKVIKGWDYGVATMKLGGTRRLIIPPELGYGSSSNGSIPANSTLIFDVQLLDIKKPTGTAPPGTPPPTCLPPT